MAKRRDCFQKCNVILSFPHSSCKESKPHKKATGKFVENFGGFCTFNIYLRFRKRLLRFGLELTCIGSLLNSNCNSYGSANHGVVAHTDQTHHINVSGNGGKTCELRIGVHTA